MNTLTGIEAERVNQILRHSIDRLNILSNLPKDWDDKLLDQIHSDGIHTSIQKLWAFERQLLSMDESYGDSSNTVNNNGGEEFAVVKHTHKAIRNVCRAIQADKSVMFQILSKSFVDKDTNIPTFVKYLNELRTIILARMTTTVEDEAAHRTLLHELTERERHFEESRDALQKKLNEVVEEKEKVTLQLDQTLRKLQAEIQDITQYNAIDLENVQKEMNEAIGKATFDHDIRMRQLQDQIDSTERRYAEMMDRHRDEEVKLRREKTRVEIALNAKIDSYDTDMAVKQKVLDDLKSSYEKELKEFAELKEHFDQVDEDIGRSKEEGDILASVVAREQFGQWVLDHAAATIQRIVRGRQGRFLFVKIKAKRSKRKGKGKKGSSSKGTKK